MINPILRSVAAAHHKIRPVQVYVQEFDFKDEAREQPSIMDTDNPPDFDTTPSLSVTSSIALDKQSASSRSIRSETDQRYKTVGNVNILNQLETDSEVFCISYTEAYEFLAAGLANGRLKLYRMATGEDTSTLCDAEMMQNPAPITSIKRRPAHGSHPITRTVIVTYANGCVKCWHYPTAQCLYTIREGRQTLGLAYHPVLPKFVTVGDDATLCLYDEETKRRERVFHGSDSPDAMDGHKSRVFSACFHPRSAHELISGGWDDTIQFWDTRQAHSLRFISGVHMCGDGLDISKSGKEILTCAWQRSNSLRLWDYGSGKLIANLEPDGYPSLLYAGKYVSSKLVACGGCDADLFRIVDLRSYSTMAMMRNVKGGVYSLDIGPFRSKYARRMRGPEMAYLPKLAFCAGSTIFEIDAQFE